MFKKTVLLFLVVHLAPFVLFAQTSAPDMVLQMGRGHPNNSAIQHKQHYDTCAKAETRTYNYVTRKLAKLCHGK